MSNILHSSESVEHYTPPTIADMARAAMGGIDLDPASCESANRLVRARQYYTEEHNGLKGPWQFSTSVFLNPPGGSLTDPEQRKRWQTKSRAVAWWRKLSEEHDEDRVEKAVFLAFSLEFLQASQVKGDNWTLPLECHICIPKKRIKFWTYDGSEYFEGSQPTHSNVIIGIGIHYGEFREAFKDLGAVK
jgi:ParB family chromosome partitioning protein